MGPLQLQSKKKTSVPFYALMKAFGVLKSTLTQTVVKEVACVTKIQKLTRVAATILCHLTASGISSFQTKYLMTTFILGMNTTKSIKLEKKIAMKLKISFLELTKTV
jgi:hypothetical protein